MAARLFTVRGRVQGVGFRWWTRNTARRLGLSGTVRNCADGSVEVRALGDETALAALGDALHHGPAAAAVTRVDQSPLDAEPAEGFEIVG
jgi:acylphosphatase